MELTSQLIGTWSVDIMYAPGAIADERIIFLSDGTGWMEIFNGNLVELETFSWGLSNHKLNIRIHSYHCISEEHPKVVQEEIRDIDFFVEDALTKSGRILKIVTFSKPICLNNSKFGLMSTNIIAKLETRISQIKKGFNDYFNEA